MKQSKKRTELTAEQRQYMKNFIQGLDDFFRTSTEPDPADDIIDRLEKNTQGFNRGAHYSQTEACAKFGITPNRYKQLILEHGFSTVNNRVQMQGYEVVTNYVLKTDFDSLNLPIR